MERLKFALVGCGRIGKRHAIHMLNYGELVAVCDILENRADELGEKYGATSYYNIESLLANEEFLDLVAICTPNGLHAEHTIHALKSGCHVLCEKPMAIDVDDCGRMIATSEKVDKKLFVVKQNRYNPPVAKVKELIDQEVLGKIFSIQLSCFWNRGKYYYKGSWRGSKDLDGGTLFTQFSHFIDLILWMIGDVGEVEAYGSNFAHKDEIEFEDTGVVILKFVSGTIGTINYTVNSYEKNMEGSLTIFGERGTVKIGGQYLNELEYQKIENYIIEDLPQGNRANEYGFYQGSMSNHDQVYQNIVDVLIGSGSITTSGYEGMKTVEVIEKIYKKIKKGM